MYNGDKCLDVRKIGYGKKRLENKEDRREAKKPGIGTFERKPGDRVYDPSISPEPFMVNQNPADPLGPRPASE